MKVPDSDGVAAKRAPRHTVHLNLWALYEPFRAEADRRHLSISDALREAVTQWLEQGGLSVSALAGEVEDHDVEGAGDSERVLLTVRPAVARLILRQAQVRGTSKSNYVTSLVNGKSSDPLPADHGEMIAALRVSSDELAALSTDLNAFMRLLGRVDAAELEPYRDSVRCLRQRIEAHLELAAALLADLDRTRRWR